MRNPQPYASPQSLLLEQHLSQERLSTYVIACSGRLDDALELYVWNGAITAAFWEQLGHLEVLLRNTLDGRLATRHIEHNRSGTWLDDPAGELTKQARLDIKTARDRVRVKGKRASHGQTVSELSFGFWRFLVAKQYSSTLWPDLASGFPHAPNRALSTIEQPVRRLHDFRNRLAHHQRIWSAPLGNRYRDMNDLAKFIDPTVAAWVAANSRVQATLDQRP